MACLHQYHSNIRSSSSSSSLSSRSPARRLRLQLLFKTATIYDIARRSLSTTVALDKSAHGRRRMLDDVVHAATRPNEADREYGSIKNGADRMDATRNP